MKELSTEEKLKILDIDLGNTYKSHGNGHSGDILPTLCRQLQYRRV